MTVTVIEADKRKYKMSIKFRCNSRKVLVFKISQSVNLNLFNLIATMMCGYKIVFLGKCEKDKFRSTDKYAENC